MASYRSYVDLLISPSTQQYIANSTWAGIWWQGVSSYIWARNIWLPEGVDWSDLHSNEDFTYPESSIVIIYPIMFSCFILIFKQFVLDSYVLKFLARSVGISNKRLKPPDSNSMLETIYNHYGIMPPEKDMKIAMEELEMSQRQVERWLRHKHSSLSCTKYDKFLDCGFHIICHTFITIQGVLILLDKPWLWNIDQCWDGYPQHNVTSDLWWFYMLGLAYYWASTFLQLSSASVKMSDSNQMLLHHVFTILLMMISWVINFVRIGTLILLVHEIADIPLLAAKLCRYSGFESVTDPLFVVFLIVWIYTRCYLYPFWILHSVYEAPILVGIPAVMFGKVLLVGLLIMNLIWTALITGIIVRKISSGSLEDSRSDVEDSPEEEELNMKRKEE